MNFPIQSLSQTVYGYPHHEVEQVVQTLWATQTDTLLSLYRNPWTKSQDDLHEPMMDAWTAWATPSLVESLSHFPHRYPTAGASEGIREVLADFKAHGGEHVAVFDGEYEGYAQIALHYHLKVTRISRTDWPGVFHQIPKRALFWVSQPSALDGNLWPYYDTFLHQLHQFRPDVSVWVDLSYVGAVPFGRPPVCVESPNVKGVVVSWSKPFGVYYHRIGALWCKSPNQALWGNRWFKNLFSLRLGQTLCETFSPFALAQLNANRQARSIEQVNRTHGVSLTPSDVPLLATLSRKDAPDSWISAFNRAPTLPFLRVCLSPSFS
jgi:histidinol-phosphate/aromatic aminotransferase/cobyric acid decarboxylase-like protein